MDCDKCKKSINGLIDNELTPEEKSEVNNHLTRCKSCRQEYEELCGADARLKKVSFTEPEDEVLRKVWHTPFSTFTRWSGIILVIVGYLALIMYGFYEFIQDGTVSVIPKISLASVIIGLLILIISVARQRIKVYKHDQYKEIER